MTAVFEAVWPYDKDALNLPVASVESSISFYESIMGFCVVSRQETPVKSVILERDLIRIGLAENGGDPTQDGCFIGVDSVEAAFVEIKGVTPMEGDLRIDKYGEDSFKVFFVVAPDGLCYCIGEKQ